MCTVEIMNKRNTTRVCLYFQADVLLSNLMEGVDKIYTVDLVPSGVVAKPSTPCKEDIEKKVNGEYWGRYILY